MRAAWIRSSQIFLLSLSLCLCTQAFSVRVQTGSVSAPVQGSALLPVLISSSGTPAIRWSFSSGSRQHTVATWRIGGSVNVTQAYEGRVQTHPNGSLTLSHLQLQDSGYYIITVTEEGNSRDTGLILSVTEVLYEDVHFLLVFVLALGILAAFLMLCMWLLNKLYLFMKQKRRCLPEHDETELQPL